MADLPPDSRTGDASGAGPSGPATRGRPRWVKVSLIIALVLVLLIGGLLVFGGGRHGPGRHLGAGTPLGGAGGQTPAAGVTQERTPPSDTGAHARPIGARAHGGAREA